VPDNKLESLPSSNVVPCGMASGLCQSFFDAYDLSTDNKEYLTPNNVAETTPRGSDCATRILTAARLYLNSLPKAPTTWGQNNSNLNDYDCNAMEIYSTFWIPDITDWWHQQEETHSKYDDFSNVAHDISYIIPHGVGVEASYVLG